MDDDVVADLEARADMKVITLIWTDDEIQVDCSDSITCPEAYWLLHKAASIILDADDDEDDDE